MADTFDPLIPQPDLKDALDLAVKQAMLSMNCHAIATVQSADIAKCTITATINYSKTYFVRQSNGTYISEYVKYPVLLDVPFIVLGGAGFMLTYPIQKGDQCLILFNDRDIDNWVAGAMSGPVATSRLHSISDGIALLGFNVPPDVDSTHMVLRNGDVKVGVSATKALITNGVTLNTLLQNLITHIQALVAATAAITVTAVTPGVGVSGPPANAAVISAISAQLAADAVAIGGLLE